MTSMTICGILIVKLYDRLENYPITISMADQAHEVQNVYNTKKFKTLFTNFDIFKDPFSCHHHHPCVSVGREISCLLVG